MVKRMENSPVTIHDVYRAAKNWGPEVAYLKGTTRNVKTPISRSSTSLVR
jgi:hypothetical protein